MATQFQTLTVRAVERLTRDAVMLSFDVPEGLADAFAFEPGQYLTLRATIDGEDVRRSYSICAAAGDGLRVGVKEVAGGRFSTYANRALSAGDAVEVMPPMGRFKATVGGRHSYLCIAAGSGITPILSIAESVLTAEPESSVTLVYGNRDTGSIMFREALEALKDRFLSRFTLIHILSREAQDVELLHGRIDGARLTRLARAGAIDPAGADAVFLCGPGDMIDGAEEALTALGTAPEKIHYERFTPADGGAPRAPRSAAAEQAAEAGARVEVILDGGRRSFPLNGAKTVLDAAHDAGLEIPYSCAGGMCCTCRCKVLEGEAEMDVNYSLQPWEVEAGFVLACQSRPTTEKLVLDFDAA
ncbi:MAG: 1,2-phenylacetyl-CoA epoxidase subunit PaaE [Pseudomonadota bacterium]